MAQDHIEQEYIPAEVYEQEVSGSMPSAPGVTLPKELNRRRVVHAFLDAFEMIGGVPALAVWAEHPDNRGDFYKLYARMAPSSNSDPNHSNHMVIKHVIPPSALDE